MEGGRTELELNVEKAKKVVELIGEALDLVEPGIGAYMAVTQVKPDLFWPHGGFMGFVTNRRALGLGLTTGVPGQPNSLTARITVSPGNFDPLINAVVVIVQVAETFSATVQGGKAPYGYAWDFGDGHQSQAPSPVHSFTSIGNFIVSLVVTDADGATGTAALHVGVTILPVV